MRLLSPRYTPGLRLIVNMSPEDDVEKEKDAEKTNKVKMLVMMRRSAQMA